jgi:hypothetical protein
MMSKRKMDEQLARQMEEESAEPELWSQKPAHIEARPARTSVLSLRLPTAEFHALLNAARSANESISTYVRNAIALRRRYEHAASTVNVTYSESNKGARMTTPEPGTVTIGAPEQTTHVLVSNR